MAHTAKKLDLLSLSSGALPARNLSACGKPLFTSPAMSPRPAGTPCTRATSAGPWDSPAAEKPNLTNASEPLRSPNYCRQYKTTLLLYEPGSSI